MGEMGDGVNDGECRICQEITKRKEYSNLGDGRHYEFWCEKCSEFYSISKDAALIYASKEKKEITLVQFKTIRENILKEHNNWINKEHKKAEKENNIKLNKIKDKYL